MDFLANENFPLLSVHLLREAGHYVVSIIVVYFRFAPATPSEPAEIFLNVIDRAALSVFGIFTIVERGRIRQRSLNVERSLKV